MARADEAVSHLKTGMSPSEIAKAMGINTKSVIAYLHRKIGQGEIRRSDILFSIPKGTREIIETLIRECSTLEPNRLYYTAKRTGHSLNKEDVQIYLDLRDARVSIGDMYEFVSEIEVALHSLIRKVMEKEYGQVQKDWWRDGVPVEVRKDCAVAREEDPEPVDDLYCYTTLIHLRKILDKQWNVCSQSLPHDLAKDKKGLMSRLDRLNRIRNRVMHPVKGVRMTEEDFEFVRNFHEIIGQDKRRLCKIQGC